MTLLALNTVVPQALRARYQAAIAGLPLGMMLSSFAPLLLFAFWLAKRLGIRPDGPVRQAANGPLWQANRKWEEQRRAGFARFILVRGVLAWGVPMFLAMHVAPALTRARSLALQSTLFNPGLWAVAGACFGAAMWWVCEANYRRLVRKRG